MNFLIEMLRYFKIRKKYFLAPLIFFLIILGLLLIGSQGTVVAPFIYTIF